MATASNPSSSGVSLPDAVKARYSDHTPKHFEHIFVTGTKTSSDSLFVPGCLTLNDCGISSAGNAGEIEQLCNGVKELDLALNNLHSWKEVFSIISQLPDLEFLNLGSNPLTQSIPAELLQSVTMPTIKRLVLNNTHAPWDAVHQLLSNMPGLEEVNLSLNDYITVTSPDKPYIGIKMCQFNSNGVTDFAEVAKIGKMFPNLENLYLAENLFAELSGNIPESFPFLKSLSIRNTRLNSWDSICKLGEFPSLTEVRMKGLPLLETLCEDERRPQLVARLPKFVRLNGSKILQAERDTAERMFIRYYMDKPPDEQPERYHELVHIHGKLDPLAEVDLTPQESATCLVKYETEQKLMNINITQTVSDFKKQLKTFVGLSPRRFRVFYFDPEMEPVCGMDELKFVNRHLYSYKVKDGDEFHIIPKLESPKKK